MVNCKNCGAPLSLSEPVCPHCGTPNPEAQEHLKKLAQISKQYKKTETAVVDQVKKSQKAYGAFTVLIVILLANLIMIPFHNASYEIADQLIASRLREDDYLQKLEGYLDRREYDEFSVYYDRLNLSYREAGDYSQFSYLIDEYRYVKNYVSDYLYSSNTYSDPLVRACSNVKQFLDDYSRAKKRLDDSESSLKRMDEIDEEFEAFIKTYLKLEDEDIEKIPDLSDSELLVLVTRRMSDEEE